MKIRNFGKTWSFVPQQIERPASVDELVEIVKRSDQVRVMGARHSWSKGIVTDGTLVTLDAMKRVLEVDVERGVVRAEAGIRLFELVPILEKQGLAFANLGSIADQSLAGAIATGTHGTGIGFKCLADQVQSLSLVDGRGEVRTLDREHPDFAAVVVGFGGFGIVYEITLNVVPCFQMHAITEAAPFDDVIENLDDYVKGCDHFKLWWFVPGEDVVIFRQTRTVEPRNDSDFKRWFKDEFLGLVVFRSLLALQKLSRGPMVRFTNRFVVSEYAKRFERICKSHVAFLTPKPPVHRETEWAFDSAGAKPLLRKYRALLLNSGYTYSMLQELRFTQGDQFWASPAHGRDSIWLSMYNIDSDANWNAQLEEFEAFAREHGGRPHWGKELTIDRDYLCANLPKLEAFFGLVRSYDPDGKFANPWLQELLGPG